MILTSGYETEYVQCHLSQWNISNKIKMVKEWNKKENL